MNERIKRIVRLLIIADCLILLFIAGIRYAIPSINSLIHPIRYIKCDEPTLQVPILYMDGKEAAKKPWILPGALKFGFEMREKKNRA